MDTPNRPRIASNLALNALGFELFLEFMVHAGAIDYEEMDKYLTEYNAIALELFEANAGLVGEQRATDIFINTIRDRIAAGACVIADKAGDRPAGGGRVVGFHDADEWVLILFSEAYAAVEEHLGRQGRTIGMGQRTLMKDLEAQGRLVEAGQVALESERPRVKRMLRSDLGLGRNPCRPGL
jgi:hypothetical protein